MTNKLKEDEDEKVVALMKYKGSSSAPEIMSEIHGGEVFSIGPACFKNNKTITKKYSKLIIRRGEMK